jgi:hypothetical protein
MDLRKVLTYVLLVAGVVVLATASSRSLVLAIWNWDNTYKDNRDWYRIYHSPWGDLVAQANMDGMEKFREPKLYSYSRPSHCSGGNVALFIFGDSYTRDIPDSAFCNISNYKNERVTGEFNFVPVAGKKNVLILEMTERNIRSILHSRIDFMQAPAANVSMAGEERKSYGAFVNKNLDYLLFRFNFLNPVKFLKGKMNYTLFERGDGNSVLSDDGRYLFYKPTVLNTGIYSSYAPLHDTEVTYVARKLNNIYTNFRKMGFKEVYLSVIPSPASILQPVGYNRLIPLLQSNPDLRIKVIDIYKPYSSSSHPEAYYRLGDTHWNNNGMHLWLDMVNLELNKY